MENKNDVRDTNGGSLNHDWILLDTCSTNSFTNNRKMIKNARRCNKMEILELETNGVQIIFNHILIYRVAAESTQFIIVRYEDKISQRPTPCFLISTPKL